MDETEEEDLSNPGCDVETIVDVSSNNEARTRREKPGNKKGSHQATSESSTWPFQENQSFTSQTPLLSGRTEYFLLQQHDLYSHYPLPATIWKSRGYKERLATESGTQRLHQETSYSGK